MTRYWIAVASREHVQRGIHGGFAQVCHGKPGPLKQMSRGDWILYYSPVIHFGEPEICRAFTAIGIIKEGEPYPFAMSNDFTPWRRNVHFLSAQEAPIAPLIEKLSFIKNKKKWGFLFRRGCFEILENDFNLIAEAMRYE